MVRLNDERVSRFHAKVQVDGDDIIITDLDSTNGTKINGNPVQIRRLRPGDQIALGRSTILFGSHAEISQRKASLRQATHQTLVPEDKTLGDITEPASELKMALEMPELQHEPPEWDANDRELPPLPQKLTPAQSARLAEIIDFLHRGLASACDQIQANDDGTVVKIPFVEWQKIQAVEMLLARYHRAIAEPDTLAD